MRREEYMDLTPGERQHLEFEMNYDGPPEPAEPELGECLYCGGEYIVDPEAELDYCGDDHALLDMLERMLAA